MASTLDDDAMKKTAADIDKAFKEKKRDDITAFLVNADEHGLADEDLLTVVQSEFGAWTHDDFQAAGSDMLAKMRNLMMNRGLYVRNHRTSGGNQVKAMMEVVMAADPLDWPDGAAETVARRKPMQTFNPDLQELLGLTAIDPAYHLRDIGLPTHQAKSTYSPQDVRFQQQQYQQAGLSRQNPGPLPPPPPPHPTVNASRWRFQDTSGTSPTDKEQKRVLQLIQKHYPTELKYKGTNDSMSLEYRAQGFLEHCSDVGLAADYVCKALPTMMAIGEPFDHCQDLRKQLRDQTAWAAVLEGMAARFESPAIVRSRANKWQSLTLQEVAREMPDKPLSEAVRALYERLARTQRCLEPEYGSSKQLLSRVINVFENHPATAKLVSFVASTTTSADSLAMIIQDGVRADERTALIAAPAFATEALYTDRTYQRNTGYNSQRSGGTGGGARKPFKCYICGKEGCRWRKHTEAEKDAHGREWRNRKGGTTAQYFTAMEEVEGDWLGESGRLPEDNDEDEGDHGITASNFVDVTSTSDDEDSPYTNFWTHAIDNDVIVGRKTVDALANQRINHALTARVEETPNDDHDSTQAFIGLSRYNNNQFMGFILDTGAATYSTCGMPQFEALQKIRRSVRLDTSTANSAHVKFGIGSTTSCGSAMIDTPIGQIEFHVLQVDTPFLVSLKDMDRLTSRFDNIRDVVISPDGETPVVRRFGHAFMTIPEMAYSFGVSSFFTATELKRLHRRFGHPSVERLHRLLTKAGNIDVDIKALRKIRDFCHNCQMHQGPPKRFKFNLRDDHDVVFNGTIVVDVAYIDGKPYIHVIDQATGFMAGRWLDNMTAQHAWDKLRECWLDTYVGPPDVIIHDQGTNFAGQEFKDNAALVGTKTKPVPTEAHHSIGQVERYHALVKRAFNIIMKEAPELSRESALQMAFKAINDTAGPNGIVPTLLVFGAYPRLSSTASPAQTVTKRAAAIKAAMKDLEKARAQRQLTEALRTRNGPDVEKPKLTDLVLVWREAHGSGSTATAAGWQGPYQVRAVDDETVKVDFGNGITSDFRSTAVRIYKATDENDAQTAATVAAAVKRGRGRPPRAARPPIGAFAALSGPGGSIWLTAPTPTPTYEVSRRAEILGLLKKGVFEPFPRADMPRNMRLFNGRFVDEIKHAGTAQAVEKSRFVVQAHSDKGKVTVLTQSPTIQRMSQRLLLCIAACRLGDDQCQLLLRDISQAYVQAATHLRRDFYVNPNADVRKILELPENMVLRILKPLYGVPEAGNHWFATYTKHHLEALGMSQSTYDACLMVRKDEAFGLVGLQTDDTLILANARFAALEKEALQKAGFLAKPRETLSASHPLKFNGGVLELADNGDLSLSQKSQVMNISLISQKPQVNKGTRGKVSEPLGTKQQYVAQRARGAYVASVCQPEAAFDMSAAAQHTDPTEEEIDALNARLEWQLANQKRGLRFVKLDESSIQVVAFTDAAFANNKDLSSQIGYVVVIRDASGKANIAHWSSTKCRRVTKSVLAAELYALMHGFDIASCIKATMDNIYERQIPLVICTDSKSIFDAVTRLGTTSEKRLMIDLAVIRQAYERREVAELKWIAGVDNPADAMTKGKPCEALTRLIDSNHIDLTEEAWVDRA